MSFSGLATPRGGATRSLPRSRSRRLASPASSAGTRSAPTHPAYAAAVSTADLPQNAPSFAPLIDRVKASVVSVKVKIPRPTAKSPRAVPAARARWTISRPEIQKFFKQFGGGMPNGGAALPRAGTP